MILFGLLLSVQFAGAMLFPLEAPVFDGLWEYCQIAANGFAWLAWPPLLAVWAVFGPQRAAVRLPLTLWMGAAINLAQLYGLNRNHGESDLDTLFLNALWLAAFGILQAPLWVIRAVRGWRLERPDFDPPCAAHNADAASLLAPRMASQFSLLSLLGWILAASLLLAAFRALSPEIAVDRENLLNWLPYASSTSLEIALGGSPMIALAWIVLADGRRLTLRIVLSLLILLGLAAACDLFGPIDDVPTPRYTMLLEAGVLLNGLVCFGVVWSCGYRLRRRPKNLLTTIERSSPVRMSRLRFAVALTPLFLSATVLACGVPHRLERWRLAELSADLIRRNVEFTSAEDGTIEQLQYDGSESIEDDLCRRIASIETMRELSLVGSAINDRQLALLGPLSHLESLDLLGTAVTDAGLIHLRQFPRLVNLSLSKTSVTDVGLRHLSELRELRSLQLSDTGVTGEGLHYLQRLPRLETVFVERTAVTAADAENFRQAHPRAWIEAGGPNTTPIYTVPGIVSSTVEQDAN